MKILMINKFLYPHGGSETYMLKLGKYLADTGHEVQYFGMDSNERCVGNDVNSYTSHMDFHNGTKFEKALYSLRTIYSSEAETKTNHMMTSAMKASTLMISALILKPRKTIMNNRHFSK